VTGSVELGPIGERRLRGSAVYVLLSVPFMPLG